MAFASERGAPKTETLGLILLIFVLLAVLYAFLRLCCYEWPMLIGFVLAGLALLFTGRRALPMRILSLLILLAEFIFMVTLSA